MIVEKNCSCEAQSKKKKACMRRCVLENAAASPQSRLRCQAELLIHGSTFAKKVQLVAGIATFSIGTLRDSKVTTANPLKEVHAFCFKK